MSCVRCLNMCLKFNFSKQVQIMGGEVMRWWRVRRRLSTWAVEVSYGASW